MPIKSSRFRPKIPILKLSIKHKRALEKHFNFYRQLPPKSKSVFEERIIHFINSKVFIPRQLQEVTSEMKVFVAASAVQLTFGLPSVYLEHFKFILIYPDDYYSTITKRYHRGEVNPRQRAIVLSWKAFVEGYFQEEGINLGLHEMAHALHLENAIRNSEFDFLPLDSLIEWDEYAEKKMGELESGDGDFFRKYAATNTHEFFAVAIENFFERPVEFREYDQHMYALLTTILNQDPIQLIK